MNEGGVVTKRVRQRDMKGGREGARGRYEGSETKGHEGREGRSEG